MNVLDMLREIQKYSSKKEIYVTRFTLLVSIGYFEEHVKPFMKDLLREYQKTFF